MVSTALDGLDRAVNRTEVLLDQLVEVGQELDLRGDVGGKFHDLVGATARIKDGIVAGLDPDFAAAYSGLSECYSVGWGRKANRPLADEYAQKAISLQPDLAEGHASLGIVRIGEYNMAGAEQELLRRIEGLAADAEAERAVLEARLHDLARRIDETIARA